MYPLIRIKILDRQLGFSLIELAIVLFIVALLLGGLLVPLTAQIDQQRTKETQKTLADLKDALIGFAIINGRFPCPASTTSNGLESPVGGGNCTNYFNGFFPAATLGFTPVNSQGLLLDGWNNPIRYVVSGKTLGTTANALTTLNGMKTATISSMNTDLLYVCSSATNITATACGAAPVITLTNDAPAIVFSLGKNGNTAGAGTDEAANAIASNNKMFVSHDPTSAGATNGEFDDIFAWIPSGILISRMVAAEQLP